MTDDPVELWKLFHAKYQELKAISKRIQAAEKAEVVALSSPCIKCRVSSLKTYTYCPTCGEKKL